MSQFEAAIIERLSGASKRARMWGSPQELEAVALHFTHVLLASRTPGWSLAQTQALQMAAKVLEPKVRPISIERATLRDDADVKAWLARQEVLLTREVALGPVLVN